MADSGCEIATSVNIAKSGIAPVHFESEDDQNQRLRKRQTRCGKREYDQRQRAIGSHVAPAVAIRIVLQSRQDRDQNIVNRRDDLLDGPRQQYLSAGVKTQRYCSEEAAEQDAVAVSRELADEIGDAEVRSKADQRSHSAVALRQVRTPSRGHPHKDKVEGRRRQLLRHQRPVGIARARP